MRFDDYFANAMVRARDVKFPRPGHHPNQGTVGQMSMHKKKRVTVPDFVEMKSAGHKITVLTAYDYTMASLLDSTDVEAILVGDSMSMVVQGHSNTLPVTLDETIYHAEMVGRAVEHALVIVDIPFPYCFLDSPKVIESAGRILKETRCQAVKLESGADMADVIGTLVSAGIPVMAHVGLRPQNVHVIGGFKVQRDQDQLMQDALAAEKAGAFSIVLECIPARIARDITMAVEIPTIGIGAGVDCDGQVLVVNDMLGLTSDKLPQHAKAYADLKTTITDAAIRFRNDVRGGMFPSDEQTFE